MDEDQMQIPLPEDFRSFYHRRLQELTEDFPFSAYQGQQNPYLIEDEYIYNYRDYELFLHAKLLKEIYDTRGDVQSTAGYWREQCSWLKQKLEQQIRQNKLLEQRVNAPPPVQIVQPPPKPDNNINNNMTPRLERLVSVFRYGLVILITVCVTSGIVAVRSSDEISNLQRDLSETRSELDTASAQVDSLSTQIADYEAAAQLYDLQLVEAASQHYEETGEVTTQSKEKSETTVYVTPTGSKYHKEGCGYLTPSTQRSMTLSEAKDAGYTACSRCW